MKKRVLLAAMMSLMLCSAGKAADMQYEASKKEALAYLKNTLLDFDSATIKFGPYKKIMLRTGKVGIEYLCLKVNEKNSMGEHTGDKYQVIVFKGGKVSQGGTKGMMKGIEIKTRDGKGDMLDYCPAGGYTQ